MTKPRVKPLEWDGWRGGITIAQSPLGRYSLSFDWRVIFPNGSMRRYKSEATAKAAAQAEYEARIISALDLTPDPAVQALVEAAREAASALVGPCDTHEGCREALDALRKALAAFDNMEKPHD